jgi:hypothetical protein
MWVQNLGKVPDPKTDPDRFFCEVLSGSDHKSSGSATLVKRMDRIFDRTYDQSTNHVIPYLGF